MAGLRSTLAAAGAINAVIAIAAGAFAAHGLREKLDAQRLAVFETGARYHMYAALGMILAGLVAASGNRLAGTGGWVLQGGALIFSGTLYALALTDVKVLGAITPVGGLGLLAGFALIAVACLKG